MRGKRVVVGVLTFGLAAPAALIASPAGANAAAPRVVINEINYNPLSERPVDEFLEFLNTTGAAIDLGGWYVDGIDYTIPAGVVAPPNGVAVIGGGMFGSFGALSNGGEELVLLDPAGTVVDAVEYDDRGEWPVLADGEGMSLQRRDPAAPSGSPGNWIADLPSPGLANPQAGAGLLPVFSDVEHTTLPAPGAPVTVTAELAGAASASLTYVIGLGAEQTVAMAVTGGTATATIPGQPAGTLVRYRLTAVDGDRSGTWPRQGDSARYRGTTVARPAPSALPTFELFMPDDVYTTMANDLTLSGDDGYPMVLAFRGEVYDSAKIRVKGQVSRFYPKKKFKIILPAGYDIDDDSVFAEPFDEFAIHSAWVDRSFLRETLASELLTAADVRATQQAMPVRIERNGGFYGLYTYLEQPDGSWRDRFGLDDSEVYEVSPDNLWGLLDPADATRSQESLRARYDKETFEYLDDDRLRDFIGNVNALSGVAEREWILANVDVPSVVNALATSMVIQHQDWGHKNYRLIFDQYGFAGVAQNDYDLVLGRRWGGSLGLSTDVFVGGAFEHPGGPFFLTFFTDPILSEMVRRRIRTVADEVFVPDTVAARITELAALVRPDAVLDRAEWGTYGGTADPTAEANRIIDEFVVPQHARLVGSLARQGRVAATPQPAVPAVTISGVGYGDPEHVVLRNVSDDSVDLSGFEIPELEATVLGGTVLLPGQEAVLVHEDAGRLVGTFPGRIRAGYFGESAADAADGLTLRNRTGALVSTWSLLPPGTVSELAGQADRSALVSLVATATGGPGFLQALACDDDPGTTSNLNIDAAGQTRSVLALARFAADGSACVFNSGPTHVVADLQGYFAAGAVDDIIDTRLLDTRSGPRPAGGTTVVVRGGRPDTTAIVSLVATDTAGPGFVSVVPCAAGAPTTSNLNVDAPGKTVAALAFVRFDATGNACLFTSADAHLIADVQGYLDDGAFDDVADARLLDTRTDGTPVTQQLVTLRGRPSSTAVVSVVATEASGPGFLQVLPCSATPGATSNVNVDRPGATVASLATVAFDASGNACVFMSTPMRVVADLQGYFQAGAFDDVADARLLDSRTR